MTITVTEVVTVEDVWAVGERLSETVQQAEVQLRVVREEAERLLRLLARADNLHDSETDHTGEACDPGAPLPRPYDEGPLSQEILFGSA